MYRGEQFPVRRSIRLPHFNYTQTAQYFVTICAFQMRCLFGRVENNVVVLNVIGRINDECWREIPMHFPRLAVDPFVVMPNHLHGILTIQDGHGDAVPLRDERFQKPVPGSIPTVLRSYKAVVTYRVRHELRRADLHVWQSNYFERVIRSGKEFEASSRYIVENPRTWRVDKANPLHQAGAAQETRRPGRGTASPCPSSADKPSTPTQFTQPR
jgi:putative transposase